MLAHSNWKVQTPMNTPINEDIVSDMIGAVELAHSMEPHLRHEYKLFSNVTPDDVHMISKEREFKYGKGKEIVAFADGPKSVSGKDMKYVKFFYIYDNKPNQVKPNAKTYTFSLPKARDFWNDKVRDGYSKIPERGKPFKNNDLGVNSIETST